jgi:hypothetical protein
MKQVRLREAKLLVQGHTACVPLGQGWDPELLAIAVPMQFPCVWPSYFTWFTNLVYTLSHLCSFLPLTSQIRLEPKEGK